MRKESENWWDEPEFQDSLVALLVQDHQTLTSCSPVLDANDFRPSKGVPDGNERWIVAERALEYYDKYGSPIGTMIGADALEYAQNLNLGSMRINSLRDYLKRLQKIKPVSPDFLIQKVIRFKTNTLKKNTILELGDLLSSGQLPDEKWEELTRRIQDVNNKSALKTIDYMTTLEARIQRRKDARRRMSTPLTMIDPLDDILRRTVGPKQLGLILAPYKRGKSTMLLWLVVVLGLQKFNVLYITLEDTRDIVEDRLDSIVSSFMGKAISTENLVNMPKTLQQRFNRFTNQMHAQIHIFDGVGKSVTVSMIERIIRDRRNEGFIPHALIIDYDEKIHSLKKHREKRFEIDEIYNDLGDLVGKYNLIGWIAAQTKRNTRHLKILSGDQIAEDIGKVRKVTCCISLGKGDKEWGDNSIFLWVAASKTAQMDRGVHIVPDLDRSLIYDRDATNKMKRQNAAKDEENES